MSAGDIASARALPSMWGSSVKLGAAMGVVAEWPVLAF
ncbi:MAG: hypothetical protein QOD72_3490, partial [Acidimicrobiaceae bacterium]|nr:hypothetical protein [Acidimicrobiaceae bacterium]